MKPISRSPARLSAGLSLLLGVVSLAGSTPYSWAAVAAGGVGIALLGVGVTWGSNRSVTLGAFALFVGTIAAGVQGGPVLPVLVAGTAAVLAWDIGHTGISLGKQLGREAETARVEAVHATASLGAGMATVGVGYALFRLGAGGQPIAALIFLLIAAVFLLSALD